MAARVVILLAFAAMPTAAWPCTTVAPLPTPVELVARATLVVRARAVGLSPDPGAAGSLAGARTQVAFEVLEVLKGAHSYATVQFNGGTSGGDDPNDGKVPYSFVRPEGRHGNCFALEYRPGTEYLLFLRAGEHAAYAEAARLTPYWAPLSPTNEQLAGGAADPWVAWVRQHLRSRPGA